MLPARPPAGLRRAAAVRLEPQILRTPPQQQVQRRQQAEHEQPERGAGRAPAGPGDQPLDPGQQHDRADPDAGEGDAERQSAAAHEPPRQIKRLPRVGQAIDPATHHRTERRIKLPRRLDQGRQQQAAAHQHDARLDHQQRAARIHHPPDQRRHQGRYQKAERERPGGDAAAPTELVEHGRKQQRIGGAGIDPDRHRDERHRHQHPAVEEGQPPRAPHRPAARCLEPEVRSLKAPTIIVPAKAGTHPTAAPAR
jgi:hypothetical protein